jgi:hypothetical protein
MDYARRAPAGPRALEPAAQRAAAQPAAKAKLRGGRSETLGAMADMMNRSPRIEAQRRLGDAINGAGSRVAQRKPSGETVGDAGVPRAAAAESETGHGRTGLPEGLKSGAEALSGLSLGDIRVHYNSARPARLGALAFAQGRDIHLAPGEERHLPHEAWHVVQQAQGRVAPTVQMADGAAVNDDARLEHEADVMGARALATGGAATLGPAAVASRPWGLIVQRLEADGQKVTVDASLAPEQARGYLVRLQNKDAKVKVENNQEYLDLAMRGMADHTACIRYAEARARLEKARSAALKIDALKPKWPKIEEIAKLSATTAEDIGVKGWQLNAAQYDWKGISSSIAKSYNLRADVYLKSFGEIRRLGLGVGLPGFDVATLKDFDTVEGFKTKARKVRAPIDAILSEFSRELAKEIPGARLAYRGSVARGVKSPSKYVETATGPGLAPFSDPVLKSVPGKLAPTGPSATFDIDGNVELPKIESGIKEGPISNSSPTNKTIVYLLDLQARIDKAIKAEKIPGYDTSEPFSFFISSPHKSDQQLQKGTPYPPHMLSNAGLHGFAETLPPFWSGELERKVQEYAQTRAIWHDSKTNVLPPTADWDPYFARLYETIKVKGPLAVAMPDVQVMFHDGHMTEVTDTAEPRNDAEHLGPVDLLTPERGFRFAKLGGTPAVGDLYAGAVARTVKAKSNDKKDMVFINSIGVTFISFEPFGSAYAKDVHVLCWVKNLPRKESENPVVTILTVIK